MAQAPECKRVTCIECTKLQNVWACFFLDKRLYLADILGSFGISQHLGWWVIGGGGVPLLFSYFPLRHRSGGRGRGGIKGEQVCRLGEFLGGNYLHCLSQATEEVLVWWTRVEWLRQGGGFNPPPPPRV